MNQEPVDYAAIADAEFEDWFQNDDCEHEAIENVNLLDDNDVALPPFYMCLDCGKVFGENDPGVVNSL